MSIEYESISIEIGRHVSKWTFNKTVNETPTSPKICDRTETMHQERVGTTEWRCSLNVWLATWRQRLRAGARAGSRHFEHAAKMVCIVLLNVYSRTCLPIFIEISSRYLTDTEHNWHVFETWCISMSLDFYMFTEYSTNPRRPVLAVSNVAILH